MESICQWSALMFQWDCMNGSLRHMTVSDITVATCFKFMVGARVS